MSAYICHEMCYDQSQKILQLLSDYAKKLGRDDASEVRGIASVFKKGMRVIKHGRCEHFKIVDCSVQIRTSVSQSENIVQAMNEYAVSLEQSKDREYVDEVCDLARLVGNNRNEVSEVFGYTYN